MQSHSDRPPSRVLALQQLVEMRQRPRRPRSLRLVTRVGDQAVEARDGVLDDRRQIVGEDAARTGLQSQVRPVDQQDAGAAVRGVGALEVAHDALDLALFGNRHGHVQVQSDDMTIEIAGWSAARAAR